jgi:cyclopropane fatty-acyl-phospholipid synthase-like methyltransferase
MTDAFFDRVYAAGGANYYGLEARPEFHDFLAALPGPHPRCLDLACGQGRHAVPAARRGARVRAVDYSRVAIDQLKAFAEREGLSIEAECADIRTLMPEPESYDAVFLVSTLSHFEEKDLEPLVAMTYRALAPGGRVFVEAFTTEDPGFRHSPDASETAEALHHFFPPGAVAELFDQFAISEYREFVEDDLSHGPAHKHGVALLIGEKV